jgi:hypothetical protein
MLQETLSDCLDIVEKSLVSDNVVLVDDFRESFMYGGIPYDEVKTKHYQIQTIRGKKTKKYLHIVITRMESGRYELVHYVS